MKIAVIEEKLNRRQSIQTILQHYFFINNDSSEIISYPDFGSFIEDFEIGEFSYLFIEEKFIRSMQIFSILLEQDKNLHAVIICKNPKKQLNHEQIDFLPNLFSSHEIERFLDNELKDYFTNNRKINLEVGKEKYEILMNDIIYAAIENHKVAIHLENRVITVRMTFSRFMDLIRYDSRFMTCNRSLIVNMDKIKEVHDRKIMLNNGVSITLDKPLKERPKNQWSQYLSNKNYYYIHQQ